MRVKERHEKSNSMCELEFCAGQVNPCELQVPAFAGQVKKPALLCMGVRGG